MSDDWTNVAPSVDSRLSFEQFRNEIRKWVRPDVSDDAIRELWEKALEVGRRGQALERR